MPEAIEKTPYKVIAMAQIRNRLKLFGNVLQHNFKRLFRDEIGLKKLLFSLRKQLILSSLFKEAKHVKIGEKIFIDPFAPYYPSRFFNTLLDNNSVDTYPLRPIHGQIAITDKCPCSCTHCHVVNSHCNVLDKDKVLETIDDMAKLHFPLIFFVGGEPLTRFNDLCDFISAASNHMDTRIFTSGVGMTLEKLQLLKKSGLQGICISLDHYEEAEHNRRRRNTNAYSGACSTIKWAVELEIYTSVVCCTTKSMIHSKEIFRMVDFAESLGAHSIQINEIRPVGSAEENDDKDFFLSQKDKQTLIEYYREENRSSRKIAIVMPWYNEEPDRFGCTATSAQHSYVDAEGNVTPCVLLKASLGNIHSLGFYDIWRQFSAKCKNPVKECLVYPFKPLVYKAESLPLPPEKTMEVWDQMCQIGPTEIYKKLPIKPEARK